MKRVQNIFITLTNEETARADNSESLQKFARKHHHGGVMRNFMLQWLPLLWMQIYSWIRLATVASLSLVCLPLPLIAHTQQRVREQPLITWNFYKFIINYFNIHGKSLTVHNKLMININDIYKFLPLLQRPKHIYFHNVTFVGGV